MVVFVDRLVSLATLVDSLVGVPTDGVDVSFTEVLLVGISVVPLVGLVFVDFDDE